MSSSIYRKPVFWYLVAIAVTIIDLLTKAAIESHFEFREIKEVTSFFYLTLVYNTGAAFSFLADAGGWQRWFFTAIAIGASVLLVSWIRKEASSKPYMAFAYAFILGGALGNLYDRIVLGHVVDFLVLHYQDFYWPAFNLADSAITLGVIIILYDVFFGKEIKQS
ncbi:MAG: signal peptidase II [Cellvibrio sp.]